MCVMGMGVAGGDISTYLYALKYLRLVIVRFFLEFIFHFHFFLLGMSGGQKGKKEFFMR